MLGLSVRGLCVLFLHKIWSVDSQENHKNCCHQIQILRLKCTKIQNSAPDHAGGAYSAPRHPSWI